MTTVKWRKITKTRTLNSVLLGQGAGSRVIVYDACDNIALHGPAVGGCHTGVTLLTHGFEW